MQRVIRNSSCGVATRQPLNHFLDRSFDSCKPESLFDGGEGRCNFLKRENTMNSVLCGFYLRGFFRRGFFRRQPKSNGVNIKIEEKFIKKWKKSEEKLIFPWLGDHSLQIPPCHYYRSV